MINRFVSPFLKPRLNAIARYDRDAEALQARTLATLLRKAAHTQFGRDFGFDAIERHIRDLAGGARQADLENWHARYRQQVPVLPYNDLKPYIDRMRQGEPDVLWPGLIRRFSKSSGTTSDKSKFIPVSKEALHGCHYKGGIDMFALYLRNYPDSKILSGKNLAMGGSLHPSSRPKITEGDVSAIIMKNLPFWARIKRAPSLKIALMDEWESKMAAMAEAVMPAHITQIAGVPSWTMVLLQRILELSGKSCIAEVWPDLEVFFHGGVSFTPYREQFIDLLGFPNFHFVETYNASEGFFSIQDRPLKATEEQDMLLMLDYGIFYEFVPVEDVAEDGLSLKADARCLHIGQVETGRQYALLITTNAGLWRYMIGDTVVFTSLHPARIQVSGRTKHFINAFGEEVIVDNADHALQHACKETGAEISEYTAGPVFLDDRASACHQWLVEFKRAPQDLSLFTRCLDRQLQAINSDYEAKRHRDILLKQPLVTAVPEGTFHAWLKHNGKLGGQHKVPRLANHRDYLDAILAEMAANEKTNPPA